MICANCGEELVQEAVFCPKCGAKVIQDEAPSNEAAPSPDQQPAPKKKRTKLIVGLVIAVVVVCAGIGAGVWWKMDQDAKQAAWERAHMSLVTLVTMDAPGFDEQATAIPVQVTGTDVDGNAVDELQFLRAGALQVETLAGTYTLTFPSGYFTGQGKVVKAPETTLTINPTVDESADKNAPAKNANESANADAPVVFVEVPDLETSREVISDIANWAKQDPEDNGKADDLSNKAVAAHDEAVAAEEERKAEEERRKAEEEAARKAAEEAERRANPSSVNSLNGPVTLKGYVQREEWTTSMTQMGWSAVAYFLVFDTPVEATFSANGTTVTQSLQRVQLESIEQYADVANKDLGSVTSADWQPYLGEYVAVKGTLYNTGNAHTLTKALLQNPELIEVL